MGISIAMILGLSFILGFVGAFLSRVGLFESIDNFFRYLLNKVQKDQEKETGGRTGKINIDILNSIAQTIILALTLWFAIQIGMTQNEINKNILNLNYEPSLTLSYQPSTPNNFGLILTNNGKTNITFYHFAAITTSTTPEKEVVVPSDKQQTIGPGQPYFIPKRVQDPDFATMFGWFVAPNTKQSLQLDIFFKTTDGVKYIYRTTFSLQNVNNLGILNWTPGTYEQYNWVEK